MVHRYNKGDPEAMADPRQGRPLVRHCLLTLNQIRKRNSAALDGIRACQQSGVARLEPGDVDGSLMPRRCGYISAGARVTPARVERQ